MATALRYEEQLVVTLRQQFETQRTLILENAASARWNKSYGVKADATQQQTKRDKREYLAALLAWRIYTDAMRIALGPILFALVVETGQDASLQVGREASQFNPTTLNVLNYYQNRANKIAVDVNAETEKQLRASLGQGIDQDEDDDQLRARIEEVMGAALTYRADRIARTETTRAQGFADIEAWKQAGTVTGKEWYVRSGNPCVFCRSLDGVVVELDSDFYSLGDVIEVDGKTLNINYDDVGSPPAHVNCQCILEPIQIDLSSGDATDSPLNSDG